jgi:hypothetical protein
VTNQKELIAMLFQGCFKDNELHEGALNFAITEVQCQQSPSRLPKIL